MSASSEWRKRSAPSEFDEEGPEVDAKRQKLDSSDTESSSESDLAPNAPNMVSDESYEALVRDLQNLTIEDNQMAIKVAVLEDQLVVLEDQLVKLKRKHREIACNFEAKRIQIAQIESPSSEEISSEDMVEYGRETDEEDILEDKNEANDIDVCDLKLLIQ
ncbi:hypothetical protein HA402_010553 [Bradysia odoriphaga]|nr:hypothetical protein HA402_010553 [Bradysia odoriphaga]